VFVMTVESGYSVKSGALRPQTTENHHHQHGISLSTFVGRHE